jgi:hypothetical protein
MRRRLTMRTVMHQIYKRLSDFFTDTAPTLVPLLWAGSIMAMILDVVAPDLRVGWGHLAIWLALSAVGVNSHALVRHMIARLTQIIALWQDDVHILYRPPAEPVRPAAGQENVVPILRTRIRRS